MIKEEVLQNNLLGKEFQTNNYGKCFVIDYKNSRDVMVMFYQPFYITKCEMGNLNKGEVCNPFFPRVYGIGYLGVGKYSSKNCGGVYDLWKGVLQRVYTSRHPTYKDVDVCKEWLDFQNFAEWCEGQEFFYAKDASGKSYHLDKDILSKGNKVYSPETCCFVPSEINLLVIRSHKTRGELPVGVTKSGNKYLTKMSCNGRFLYLGTFNTSNEAFLAYKTAKESYIKQVAERWKNMVDVRVINSLMQYEVNIDD